MRFLTCHLFYVCRIHWFFDVERTLEKHLHVLQCWKEHVLVIFADSVSLLAM